MSANLPARRRGTPEAGAAGDSPSHRRGRVGHAAPPVLAAVVEIAADAEGRLPANLIRAAYLASRSGTVALVLTDISSVTIDRLLDEIVSTALDVRGVLYCTAEDVDRLICDRGRPLVALGSAERLRRALVGHHVDMIPCAQGADVLASLSMGKAAPGPPGARIPRHAV